MKKGETGVLKFVPEFNPSTRELQWVAKEHKDGVKTRYVAISHSDNLPSQDDLSPRFFRFRVERRVTQTHNHKIRIMGVHLIEIQPIKPACSSQNSSLPL